MAETDLPAEEALAKNAAKAAKLALFCLVVAVLVLAIDHRLKHHIIEEGKKALRLLDEARKLAEEAKAGGPLWAARPDRADPGTDQHPGDGMVHASPPPAAADNHEKPGLGEKADRAARKE